MIGTRVRFLLACVLMTCAVACTTVQSRVTKSLPEKPKAGTQILVLKPDIQLSLLTASGIEEPNEQWSREALTNVSTSLNAALANRQQVFVSFDPDTITSGRANQILRLHDAVAKSILAYNFGVVSLPTKPSDKFDWTLGPGALELARASAAGTNARYALITLGRGSYSSGGRVALMLVGAAVGASVPLGGQQIYASLIELETGKIVWFNLATAAPQSDMRKPEGAEELVKNLLKDVPL
ncbi:MAG: hypothetical protein RL186_1123 [Pseudomonadota bacterium]|jgi:hypothetical protein